MSTAHKVQWPTVFSGLRGITWANFPSEISAGITLAALIIPLNIGYAQVAGLPPVFGLYAGIIPLAIFAIFTSSPHVVGSPDAPISAILGAVLIGFAPIGDPLRVQFALALALMCGLLFFVFWFFRLAFLANFLSRAVLAGFITGLGIEVLTNQARRILGASHVVTDRDWGRSPNNSMVRWRLPLTPRVILWSSSPCLSPYLMRIFTQSRSGWVLLLSCV